MNKNIASFYSNDSFCHILKNHNRLLSKMDLQAQIFEQLNQLAQWQKDLEISISIT